MHGKPLTRSAFQDTRFKFQDSSTKFQASSFEPRISDFMSTLRGAPSPPAATLSSAVCPLFSVLCRLSSAICPPLHSFSHPGKFHSEGNRRHCEGRSPYIWHDFPLGSKKMHSPFSFSFSEIFFLLDVSFANFARKSLGSRFRWAAMASASSAETMTYPGQLQQVPQRTQANLLLPDFDSIPGEYSPGRGKGNQIS